MKRKCEAVNVNVLGLLSACFLALQISAKSEDLPSSAKPDGFVHCRVLVENRHVDGIRFELAERQVPSETVKSLPQPMSGTSPEPPAEGTVAMPDVHGAVTNLVSGNGGDVVETYTGDLTNVVGTVDYPPLGNRIILKPTEWWPAGRKDSLEIYTASLPHQNLRAIWWRSPVFDGFADGQLVPRPPMDERYFAAEIQLYHRRMAIRKATFTGTKATRAQDGKTSTTSLTKAEISLDGTEWKNLEIYPQFHPVKLTDRSPAGSDLPVFPAHHGIPTRILWGILSVAVYSAVLGIAVHFATKRATADRSCKE